VTGDLLEPTALNGHVGVSTLDDYSLTSSPSPTFAYCSLRVDCKFEVPDNKKKGNALVVSCGDNDAAHYQVDLRI
jgi:hypothetical protein